MRKCPQEVERDDGITGHDNGLIVFKLERERPAFSLSGNHLFYVKDKIIRMADLAAGTSQGICSVRKLGSQWVQPRTLSYNPAEKAVIVTSVSLPAFSGCSADQMQTTENGQYELVTLPKSTAPSAGDGKDTPSDGRKGAGMSAIFVARNRLAVLDKAGQVSLPQQSYYMKLTSSAEHRDQGLVEYPHEDGEVPRPDQRGLLRRYRFRPPLGTYFGDSLRHSAAKGACGAEHSFGQVCRMEHGWKPSSFVEQAQ